MKTKEGTRRFPRIGSQNVIFVRALDRYDYEVHAETMVMGLGGCMFKSPEPAEVDGLLGLYVCVNDQVAKAVGRVIYSNPMSESIYEVGIEFVDVEPESLAIIKSLFDPAEGC